MKAGQEALKAMNPDVFIGVEVNDWDAFHQVCSVVPGLVVHVVSSFRDPMSGNIRPQQIGIASKLKCRGAWWETWKANVPNISRGFSFAALESPSGKLLMVYGNHLKSNRGSDKPEGEKSNAEMRAEQTRQLLAHTKEMSTAYEDYTMGSWIITGDLNTNHDGQFPQCKVLELLTSAGYYNTWLGVPKEERLTWRTDPEDRFKPTTFDYFLTRGLPPLKATVIDQPMSISDHTPIQLLVPQP
jgi:endonuclease/exonuclease/phosphatase family metal-dependent hydrolase